MGDFVDAGKEEEAPAAATPAAPAADAAPAPAADAAPDADAAAISKGLSGLK
jgi:hypothetical protein